MEKGISYFKQICVLGIICFLIIPAFLFAQESEHLITFRYNNIHLIDALNYLINEYSIPVVFQDKDVDSKKVSANCESCKIDVALNLILNDTSLKWKKVEKQYIIFKAQTVQANEQTTADISGCVVDSLNEAALPFANILLKDTNKGTISNLEGQFALLNAPAQLCTVQVKYIGYTPNEVLTDASDNPDYLTIKMKQEAIKTKGVTVTGDRLPVLKIVNDPGQARFSPRDLNFIPSANRSDIMQSLQALPSVSFFSNELDGLYVRGGTPDQNLVLFDGIPIYHTEHLMGFMSALNSYAIDEVKLHKGMYSAKYGDRLSSIIEIQGKSADTTKFKAGFHANFFSAQGFVQVPFSEKLHGYFTYRKSYFGSSLSYLRMTPNYGVFSSRSIKNFISNSTERNWISNSDIDFYDITGKFIFKPTTKDTWYFTVYSGEDLIKAKKGYSSDSIPDRTQKLINYGSSIKWVRRWSNKIKSESVFAHTRYSNDYDISNQHFEKGLRSSDATNTIVDYIFRSSCEMEFNPLLNICWGSNISVRTIKNDAFYTKLYAISYSGPKAHTKSFYLQDKIKLSNISKLTLGLRGSNYTLKRHNSYFTPINKFHVHPQASLQIDFSSKIKFHTALDNTHQYIHRFSGKDLYNGPGVIWTLPDGKLPPSFGEQKTIGLMYKSEQVTIEISAYHKKYDNLFYFMPPAVVDSGQYFYDFCKTGTGKSLGLEFFAQKKQGFLQGWISYHLGKTEYQFDTVNNGKTFLADFDRRHELKTVIYFPLGSWKCSMAGYYASGKPYTPVGNVHSLTLINAERRWFIHMGNRNSRRLPDYKRLDVSLAKPFKNKFSVSGEIGLSILNLFGIDNYSHRTYTLVESENIYNSERYMLGFTPMLFVDLEFR